MDAMTPGPSPDRPAEAPNPLEAAVARLGDEPGLDPLVERLRTVAGPVGRGGAGDLLRGRWLGHALHPMLTDLPVGCWTSAWFLDLVGGPSSRGAAQRLVGLGLLAVPATAAAGLADWSTIEEQGTRRVGAVHAALNGVASLCYLGSWRHRRRDRYGRGVAWGMVGALAATAAGHLGGHLAFGGDAGPSAERSEPDDELAPPTEAHERIGD
jgi:uncharacterized membrane protein